MDRGARGSQDAWLVAGDFNRRLDAGGGSFQDEVWEALSGYRPRPNGAGAIVDTDNRADIELFRSPDKEVSACWVEFRNARPGSLPEADGYSMLPIEFFVFGKSLAPLVKAPWICELAFSLRVDSRGLLMIAQVFASVSASSWQGEHHEERR